MKLFVLLVLEALPLFATPQIALRKIQDGLNRPVGFIEIPDGSDRFAVPLQTGKILIRERAGVRPEPFLDLSEIVSCCDNGGLLSVAFHPSYAANGRFFVQYVNLAGDTVIAEFTVSTLDRQRADPLSQQILFVVDQPEDNLPNHHGGQLTFGPDGYLWISIGDGGAYRVVTERAQDLSHLLGKMIRVDVDRGRPYTIPGDNPFAGRPDVRQEIWSYGLRNPWRYSFDRLTGDLLIADVGQDLWEEVNFHRYEGRGGENYGWPRMEGSHCFLPTVACNNGSLVLPVLEYDRSGGCSVTGGYVYRGTAFPGLQGTYFYGDWCTGKIWAATPDPGGNWQTQEILDTEALIVSFGEDLSGELYVVDQRGTIYQIADARAGRRRAAAR